MSLDSWEYLSKTDIKNEFNEIKGDIVKLSNQLQDITKINNDILRKLNENQDIYKSSYIEHKYHSKNIRDLLEIFSDIIIKDKSKEDPFIESRMHNRMWRHSIKNIDDIKGIQQCKLMDVYKNFNSK